MADESSRGTGGEAKTSRTTGVAGGDPSTDVLEIVGSIKWFDVSKGFGFIVPDDDLPDVLLHVSCLRDDGFPDGL